MVSGIGVHSGVRSNVTLHRSDGPIRFRRGVVEIPALVENVASADRSVVLARDGARAGTVEHLLAALQLAGFWSGVVVEVDAEELPILDGSGLPWHEEIASLGQPPAPPSPLRPHEPRSVTVSGATARVVPRGDSIDVSVNYPHPAIGSQRWRGNRSEWRGLLDARTFGFLSEAEGLLSAGMARGAGHENAIVFGESRPLRPLRHDDEPVRHKALDLVGDLTLLGRPLEATIQTWRGSHRLHVNLMRDLTLIEAHGNIPK